MKKWIRIAGLLLLTLPVAVSAIDYTYTTNNGAITITKYTGPSGAVTIPKTINSLPVSNIGDSAFYNCTKLTNITIPNSVTNIGDYAFYNCYRLTNITIPNSVTSIEGLAFYNCTGLTNVVIGSKVTTIGQAFVGCSNLVNVVIPNSVTSIGGATFRSCTSLNNVTIPNSVTSIGDAAFFECTSLTNITIPAGVTNVGSQAFLYCANLMEVVFQGNAPNLGADAFRELPATAVIYYQPGTIGWTNPWGGRTAMLWALRGFSFIENSEHAITITKYTGSGAVTIPNVIEGLPVTSIKFLAFFQCASLTSVTIPASVTSIGNTAFGDCIRLKSVYFLGNAPSLGSTVFTGVNSATIYYMPVATGWGSTFAGLPVMLWNPAIQTGAASFGVKGNGFGFNITGATNYAVAVEACTNLSGGVWEPVQTGTLTNGAFSFSDPQWTNYPGRFYRLRMP